MCGVLSVAWQRAKRQELLLHFQVHFPNRRLLAPFARWRDCVFHHHKPVYLGVWRRCWKKHLPQAKRFGAVRLAKLPFWLHTQTDVIEIYPNRVWFLDSTLSRRSQ